MHVQVRLSTTVNAYWADETTGTPWPKRLPADRLKVYPVTESEYNPSSKTEKRVCMDIINGGSPLNKVTLRLDPSDTAVNTDIIITIGGPDHNGHVHFDPDNVLYSSLMFVGSASFPDPAENDPNEPSSNEPSDMAGGTDTYLVGDANTFAAGSKFTVCVKVPYDEGLFGAKRNITLSVTDAMTDAKTEPYSLKQFPDYAFKPTVTLPDLVVCMLA